MKIIVEQWIFYVVTFIAVDTLLFNNPHIKENIVWAWFLAGVYYMIKTRMGENEI